MPHANEKTNILTNDCWIKTSLGSNVKLSAQKEISNLKNPILLLGGVHGDEPEGVYLAEKTLAWLKGENQTNLVDWLAIPCLNVDGYRERRRVNARGVDLNRNFPSSDWSDKFDKERYFPGEAPESEIETRSLVKLIKEVNPRLIIHCHSWKPCIVYTGDRAQIDSERLGRNSGYGVQSDIGYATPGSLGQYACFDLDIPVICIEEQEELKDFAPIWPRFEKAMKDIFTDLSDRGLPPRSSK